MKQCKIGVECVVQMGAKGERVWDLMGSSETIIKGVLHLYGQNHVDYIY
jgi:hypothetical protein